MKSRIEASILISKLINIELKPFAGLLSVEDQAKVAELLRNKSLLEQAHNEDAFDSLCELSLVDVEAMKRATFKLFCKGWLAGEAKEASILERIKAGESFEASNAHKEIKVIDGVVFSKTKVQRKLRNEGTYKNGTWSLQELFELIIAGNGDIKCLK